MPVGEGDRNGGHIQHMANATLTKPEVRGLAQEHEATNPVYPDHLETTVAESSFDRHFYVDADGKVQLQDDDLGRPDTPGRARPQ